MRPSKEQYFLRIAHVVATRGTCLRRKVGCVLTNSHGHILATGYNGRPAGMWHCDQEDAFDPSGYPHACTGAFAESGMELDKCEAVHAEQNALLQCRDVQEIRICYVTVSPCIHCIKMLMNTACNRIVTPKVYDEAARQLWEQHGRTMLVIPDWASDLGVRHLI
jgi:dCMP deaminase